MKMRLFLMGLLGIAFLSFQGSCAKVEEQTQETFSDRQDEPAKLQELPPMPLPLMLVIKVVETYYDIRERCGAVCACVRKAMMPEK